MTKFRILAAFVVCCAAIAVLAGSRSEAAPQADARNAETPVLRIDRDATSHPAPDTSANWRPISADLGILLSDQPGADGARTGTVYTRIEDRWVRVRLESDAPRGVMPARP